MGIQMRYFPLVLQALEMSGYGGPPFSSLNICELGAPQYVHCGEQEYEEYTCKLVGTRPRSGRNLFTRLGFNYFAIDINAPKAPYALTLDLGKPFAKGSNLCEYFDVITNFGTSEHVDNQTVLFDNAYSMLKTKGIMINFVPMIGIHHGIFQYTKEFFSSLRGFSVVQCIEVPTIPPFETGSLLFAHLQKLEMKKEI
jgi:hypothetical protein